MIKDKNVRNDRLKQYDINVKKLPVGLIFRDCFNNIYKVRF